MEGWVGKSGQYNEGVGNTVGVLEEKFMHSKAKRKAVEK